MQARLKRLLNQPYPEEETFQAYLQGALFVGCIVFFLLFGLRPFDLDHTDNPLAVSIIFAGITVLVSLLYDLSMHRVLRVHRDKPSWTFGRWLASSIMLIVFIGAVNFLALMVWFDMAFSPNIFMQIVVATLLIGLVPLLIIGGFRLGSARAHYEHLANSIGRTAQPTSRSTERRITLAATHGEIPLEVLVEDILFAEAMQNYVLVIYIQDESVQRSMIRTTMKALAAKLNGTRIVRCHRSYLVNLDRVENISGNAQGLKLELQKLRGIFVPVSRRYIETIKSAYSV